MPDISLMVYHLILKIVLRDYNFYSLFLEVKTLGAQTFPKVAQISDRSKFTFKFDSKACLVSAKQNVIVAFSIMYPTDKLTDGLLVFHLGLWTNRWRTLFCYSPFYYRMGEVNFPRRFLWFVCILIKIPELKIYYSHSLSLDKSFNFFGLISSSQRNQTKFGLCHQDFVQLWDSSYLRRLRLTERMGICIPFLWTSSFFKVWPQWYISQQWNMKKTLSDSSVSIYVVC